MVGQNRADKLISIHAPREGGDVFYRPAVPFRDISIHAPREGGDLWAVVRATLARYFNPRPPRGGRL